MSFCEPLFLFVFLPLTLLCYFAAPKSLHNAVLCLASCIFYLAGDLDFAPWLLGSVALNYLLGHAIERWRGLPAGKALLWLGISSDLALLVVFKYLNFLHDNLNILRAATGYPGKHLAAIALPLGISFFTFHKISYKVDIWRGQCRARRSIIEMFLYILVFPQLIAGPIVRFNEVAPALASRTVRLADFAAGAQRFLWGLAKKMVIANPLAAMVDPLWGAPGAFAGLTSHTWDTPSAWVAAIGYSLQIYFDFSGYSDMAVGLAQLFGFRFPENFNFPYQALSVTDFWRRWHMSLSRWFRDYVYIPLGGNRLGLARTLFNLMTVFMLCGFWHGAQWTFVVWGAYHGAWLICERLMQSTHWGQTMSRRIPGGVAQAYTLLVVLIGWVLFRAGSLAQAREVVVALLGGGAPSFSTAALWQLFGPEAQIAMAVGLMALVPFDAVKHRTNEVVRGCGPKSRAFWAGVSEVAPAALSLCVFIYTVSLLAGHAYSPFIYYRF